MDRYALLLVAMSDEEAKKTLGFGPDDHPTKEQINKAWRAKVFESHPDRGGSNDAVADVNVARDILEGKQRPTYDRSAPPSYNPPSSHTYTPPTVDDKTVTLDEAKTKAGIPADVSWMFVTDTQRSKDNYAGDSSSHYEIAFAVYGRTDSEHVFVGAYNFSTHMDFIERGKIEKRDIWTVRVTKFPLHGAQGKNPAWLYGNVVRVLADAGFKGKFNSKVHDVPEGWKIPSKSWDLPHGSAISIKQWLVNRGEVQGEDPSVAGRKHVVEILHESKREQVPGYYREPPTRGNEIDGHYMGDYHKIELSIDGKIHTLNEKDTEAFLRCHHGRTPLINSIFGDYIYGDKVKRALTRLKYGKVILEWMAKKFEGLPADAREILTKASAQMKGTK